MADTCIVCLGDLRVHTAEPDSDPPPEAAEAAGAAADASKGEAVAQAAKRTTRANAKSIDVDEESIAHLLPCKHDLHNACLKPWVERANSCPICRAKFNMVEMSQAVGGPIVDSYAVADKVQEAELDPTMIIEEDELFAIEAWEPCMVCGATDETHELMYCDGCDKAVHVFCAGHQETPDVWYCETCLSDLETDTGLSGLATATRRQPRRRPRGRALGGARRNNDAIWARVWQEVSRRVGLDLDFPYDDDAFEERMPRQREQWQQRLVYAENQGAGEAVARLRNIATATMRPLHTRVQPEPESQEEIRAWNAFNKARESQDAPVSVRRRKRKATESPISPRDPNEPAEQPQLKKPRMSRRPLPLQQLNPAEASATAVQRQDDKSTFLSSLLKDVETKPLSAGSPGASEQYTGQWSPRNSSPVRSPVSSSPATPRALSPAPQAPISPPLSDTHMPASSPNAAIFSPFSPTSGLNIHDIRHHHHDRGRQRSPRVERRGSEESLHVRGFSGSPSRALSYSAKEEIQRMVKLALGPRYRDKEISKEQYTDINRDVSRRMYERVGDASALTDQAERERWQGVAEDEVNHAVAVLHFGDPDEDA